jgi:type 1 glutamine amidotransferase
MRAGAGPDRPRHETRRFATRDIMAPMKPFAALAALSLLLLVAALAGTVEAKTADGKQKLVLIAGKPSHPPRMHEFRAGSLLLGKCLADVPGLVVDVHDDGWVKDEKTFDDADAVVVYADGGGGHPALQGDHLKTLERLIAKGVGFGCMHYGVEVPADKGGPEFRRWIGGHYEHMFSVNPIWEPRFDDLPDHPITRGVKPFQVKDEWYFNMRFADDLPGAEPAKLKEGGTFTPILVAKPGDTVRKGPYVYPPGPYAHIVAAAGRPEAMMWAVERPDGGRGFGFTGGHFHDNWGNDDFRKAVLNALVWVAKAEVPETGIGSKVEKDELDKNLDPKK